MGICLDTGKKKLLVTTQPMFTYGITNVILIFSRTCFFQFVHVSFVAK